jgi:predicted RNA-binding Zn-ribbon protein involved in translation (DUF1610 family)
MQDVVLMAHIRCSGCGFYYWNRRGIFPETCTECGTSLQVKSACPVCASINPADRKTGYNLDGSTFVYKAAPYTCRQCGEVLSTPPRTVVREIQTPLLDRVQPVIRGAF